MEQGPADAIVSGARSRSDEMEQGPARAGGLQQRDVISLTDRASYLGNKITFLLDAMLGVVNIQQNSIIRIFSIMAVVFMPPGVTTDIANRVCHVR
jgi:magnesium transporter